MSTLNSRLEHIGPIGAVPTTNRLLLSLDPNDLAMIAPLLRRVELTADEILMSPDQEVHYAYFPEAGTMVLLFSAMEDGRTAQSATVSNHGVVGLIEAGGDGRALTRAMVAMPGPAYTIQLKELRGVLRRSTRLREMMARYTEAVLGQVMQNAACNALHTVDRRVARWIITAHDCALQNRETDFSKPVVLPLKQELMGDALGVQRTTVTLAAKRLQQAGLVQYTRGRIAVIDRSGLEAASCECHQRLWRLFRRLIPSAIEPWRPGDFS